MIEYIYASAATAPFSADELVRLLAAARARNEKENLTGVLLYHQGSFLQVLEGEEQIVDAAVTRIKKDPRHRNVLLLLRRSVAERSFADWRMGFVALTPATNQALEGFSDFLRGGLLGLQGNPQAVSRTLLAFREGSYHQAIR